jgi:hypothetical protein
MCTQRLPTNGTSQTNRGVANPGRYPMIAICRSCVSQIAVRQCSAFGIMSHR